MVPSALLRMRKVAFYKAFARSVPAKFEVRKGPFYKGFAGRIPVGTVHFGKTGQTCFPKMDCRLRISPVGGGLGGEAGVRGG